MKMKKKLTYNEQLIDWILQFGTTDSPSDSQFSATQVADLIMKFNSDKSSGKIKFDKV